MNTIDSLLFSVICDEPEGAIGREVHLAEISREALVHMYQKLKDFKILFDDYTQGDAKAFLDKFIEITPEGEIKPKGLLLRVDDVGVIFFANIVPNDSADVHISFWDRRLKGRANLVKKALKFAFESFNLYRISTTIVESNRVGYIKKQIELMGFQKEGCIRGASLFEGKRKDLLLYGILASEVN